MLACERWTLTHNFGCAVASALGLAVTVGLVLLGLVLLGLGLGLAAM